MHYQRLRQYGSLERTTDMVYDVSARFWRHVEKTEGCWLWTGVTYPSGYGQLHFKGSRNVRAHRFAYELLVGPIPEAMTIDHLCHDSALCSGGASCPHRRCVNPEHLALATVAENVRRSLKGRRGGRCKRGHELDYSAGRGICRSCRNAARRQRRRDRQAPKSLGSNPTGEPSSDATS
jgi:hypothetical protein